ncbi:hypothetical protein EON65_57960 [archaeon]|nr:MAG: hypothetical protein EON65_57960 [archaeon]
MTIFTFSNGCIAWVASIYQPVRDIKKDMWASFSDRLEESKVFYFIAEVYIDRPAVRRALEMNVELKKYSVAYGAKGVGKIEAVCRLLHGQTGVVRQTVSRAKSKADLLT